MTNLTVCVNTGLSAAFKRMANFPSTFEKCSRLYFNWVFHMQIFIHLCPFVDELVLLGNHRDAWVFGAADASSGTAAMMELSRVLGAQLKNGTSQLNAESCTSLLK